MSLFHERSGRFSPEKTIALIGAFVPLAWLGAIAFEGALGARPVTEAIHFTGLWALRFLILSLAVTPVRRLFFWPKLILARRTLGLAALGYALLHLALFFIDQGAARAAQEIVLRFYLTMGAVGIVLLVALGATSFDAAIRRLGGKRWNALHASVYAIAVLAVAHFFFQSKLDVTEPVLMGGVLIFLFAYRIAFHYRRAVTPLGLAALAAGSSLLTALLEVAWYGLATRVDPWLVAEANLGFDLGPRPMWWVLALGLAAALAAALRQRLAPPPERARRVQLQPSG